MFRFLLNDVDNVPRIQKVLDSFQEILDKMLYPFFIALGAASMVYAIWLGVSYSKSEGDARGEAKKRIINFIIGLISIIVLCVLLKLYVDNGQELNQWIGNMVKK